MKLENFNLTAAYFQNDWIYRHLTIGTISIDVYLNTLLIYRRFK